MKDIINIKSISEAHEVLGLGKPKHPLVSVYQHQDMHIDSLSLGHRFALDLYHIIFKTGHSGSLQYGRNSYDFQDGTMVFTAPGQVVRFEGAESYEGAKGWSLLFHPDLIRKSTLGLKINNYDFFSYDVYEALHVSDDERQNIMDLAHKIENEYNRHIDKHSQNLIVSNIQLLLDYCIRYYDRQFYTRTNLNKDIVSDFDNLIRSYFASEKPLELGVPTVSYCGEALKMSPKYLSDLLKKETGKNAQEHIYYHLVNNAKTKLLGTSLSIGEIAYSLGFEYPQHFTKIFKTKTGMSPAAFRKS